MYRATPFTEAALSNRFIKFILRQEFRFLNRRRAIHARHSQVRDRTRGLHARRLQRNLQPLEHR